MGNCHSFPDSLSDFSNLHGSHRFSQNVWNDRWSLNFSTLPQAIRMDTLRISIKKKLRTLKFAFYCDFLYGLLILDQKIDIFHNFSAVLGLDAEKTYISWFNNHLVNCENHRKPKIRQRSSDLKWTSKIYRVSSS